VVLFLDPKMTSISATRFILRWILLNKTVIPPFWVGICRGGTLRTKNLTILNTQFYFWTPNYGTKVPPDLFYGEICWTKPSFPQSESEFVWEIPLGFKISKFWIRSFISRPQNNKQNSLQIYSTVKFVEQNFHLPQLPLGFKISKFWVRH
jgi:hypothetical protein